jgi:hypothetical protein
VKRNCNGRFDDVHKLHTIENVVDKASPEDGDTETKPPDGGVLIVTTVSV